MKRLVLCLVLGILILSFAQAVEIIENAVDDHGCNVSAGYLWCEGKQKCVTSWADNCPVVSHRGERIVERVNARLGRNYTIEDLENRSMMLDVREQLSIYKAGNKSFWLNLYLSNRNISIEELSQERLEIIAERTNARTGLNLSTEEVENGTALKAFLSNGRWADVKIMPDTASARALAVLGGKCAERNCTVELKEVGKSGINQTRLAYEVSTEKDSRVLLLFRNRMRVTAQVDAETGQVISTKKPWWSFLAREQDESISSETNITA